MRVLIVTDAWYPQINGVVRTLTAMRDRLTELGHTVYVLNPEKYPSIPCPTYPEIRLALAGPSAIAKVVHEFRPEIIHIATEGPLGFAARRFCLRQKLPFTTAFHTRFPEYVEARFRIPVSWTYRFLRWFHRPARRVMAPTPTVVESLIARGFGNVKLWGRGVDTELFRPLPRSRAADGNPVLLFVGRVAVEKNISAFLDLAVDAHKVVVGDGPQMAALKARYQQVEFVGAKHGEELVAEYNRADVFVFPSRTDTFGLVMLEALACGVPVAAYPVMGPKDVITDTRVGALDTDLATAVCKALQAKRSDCRAFAEQRSWMASAKIFFSYLQPFDADRAYAPGA